MTRKNERERVRKKYMCAREKKQTNLKAKYLRVMNTSFVPYKKGTNLHSTHADIYRKDNCSSVLEQLHYTLM